MPDILAQPQSELKIMRATTIQVVARDASSGELPDKVIGQVEGIALVYDVLDSFGTTFAPGCLERTSRERVPLGKVKLYLDHGDAPLTGMYDTHLHIGVVRSIWDVKLPDGTSGAMFRADIFDNPGGREAYEYLQCISATRCETGISIGMLFAPPSVRAVVDGIDCRRFHEVPLREISITSESSVPGTKVTAVRTDVDYYALIHGALAHVIERDGKAAVRAHLSPILSDAPVENSDADTGAPRDSDSHGSAAGDSQDVTRGGSEPLAPNVVSMAERLAWCRTEFPRLYPP